MNYHSPAAHSKYQDAVGMCPREFDVCIAVLAHEKSLGCAPTRLELCAFFNVTSVHSERLVRNGYLTVSGKPMRIASTARLAREFGVAREERRSA